jgi:hypothetical protein
VKPNGLTRARQDAAHGGRPAARVDARAARTARGSGGRLPAVSLPARARSWSPCGRPRTSTSSSGAADTTVFERGAAARRDLLGVSGHAAKRFERVTLRGRGSGQFVYADVFLPKTGVAGFVRAQRRSRRTLAAV